MEQQIVDAASAAVATAVSRLSAVGARTEELAELRPAHRTLLIPRPARFVRIAPVWRLGVLLLTVPSDGMAADLFATGSVTRARDPKHPNFTSISGEERREQREAARKAGYGEHDTVNFDAMPLPFDETLGSVGPLVMRDDDLAISWDASRTPGSLRPFADYLRERVELAARPPEGAGEAAR